jgi:hypothetical protein
MFVAFSSFGFRRKERANLPGRYVFAHFWNKKLAAEFSATNAPNPPHFDPKLVFVAFLEFRFRRNNGAKLAREVVIATLEQKILQLNFPQRTTQSTLFEPKTHVCCFFSVRFDEKRAKLARRAVLATFGTKKLAVEFSAMNAPIHPV